MKELEIKGVVFLYSCIRNFSENTAILKNTITQFLKKNNAFLIIINDSLYVSLEDVIQRFNLAQFDKAIVCSITNCGWEVYNSNTKSKSQINKLLAIDSILELVQEAYNISKASTIAIGKDRGHFLLTHFTSLYFHVGKQEDLDKKIRKLIPLTDQYETGVNNILQYFISKNFTDSAIDYSDLVQFVDKAKDFFNKEESSHLLFQKHMEVSNALAERFSEEIIAIFGTGFPFYISKKGTDKTPNSILSFFDIQYKYFMSKVMGEEIFIRNLDKKFSARDLYEKFNIKATRNKFDNYKYEKMNHQPPVQKESNSTLEEYHANACFDIISDIWPCYYCVTLQIDDWFPYQNILKDTNLTCLPCKQTAFMLRNIMSCCSDIDMLIVVRQDKKRQAEAIKDYIMQESPYYLCDCDFR